jgi:hypothetical protein
MTTQSNSVSPKQALYDALEALAEFDASTLINEDGSQNAEAEGRLRRLQDRVEAARARSEGVRAPQPNAPERIEA